MSSLVVLGSLVLDRVYRVPRLPQPGESVMATSFEEFLGGKGINQAFAASRAGIDVRFVGCIGTDRVGAAFRHALEQEVVGYELMTDEGQATGSAAIWVDDQGMNAIAVDAGANLCLEPDFVSLHCRDADFVLTQLEIPLACIERIPSTTRLILNPAPVSPLPDSLLARTWLITPNETETFRLTGILPKDRESCRLAAERLQARGVRQVVLTLGAQGCYFCGDEGEFLCPAVPVRAVDSTAAGDVFNGYLAAQVATGCSVPDALRLSCAAASLSVTRPGALPSIPRRSEVENWMP